ncbi:hypothetical protein [Cognatishimia maritima]|uniref:DUF1330 domain-containing protein n=1 Tax=Cognatishimia maritima TaxID=870908 RepID=A0A1M5VYK9_9RHOB|nr:hypothetical protein [Cognatishimia maritima]SHH80409.1 hypothetical protein SAMN04488044_3324 [Cognatishimia maritima]
MTFVLFDILPIKSGKTVDDATAYFDKVRPAMERNGLRRVDVPFEVQGILRGNQEANLVNIFETEDPESAMKKMGADPEYQSHIEERDAIFDLGNASIILTTRRL